jgi:hypothetical protein
LNINKLLSFFVLFSLSGTDNKSKKKKKKNRRDNLFTVKKRVSLG